MNVVEMVIAVQGFDKAENLSVVGSLVDSEQKDYTGKSSSIWIPQNFQSFELNSSCVRIESRNLWPPFAVLYSEDPLIKESGNYN